MSANGEIEIAVKAEGVEDAAGEFDQGGEGGGPPAGGGGQSGEALQSTASSTGRMAGLLGTIVALLAVLEPILKVLGVVSNVLQAFVAPLAMVLMRLLQPALRWLLQLLPGWINWIEENEGKIDAAIARIYWLGSLLAPILELVLDGVKGLRGWFEQNWPFGEGDSDTETDPFTPPSQRSGPREGSIADLGPREWFNRNILDAFREAASGDGQDGGNGRGPGNAPSIVFTGGLGALVETIETNPNIDQ